jgi:uncharacterized membrane protein
MRVIAGVMAGLLALIISFSIALDRPLISFAVPVIAILIALIISVLLRKRAREVMQDERTSRIHEKASSVTIAIGVPVMAAVSIVILALRSRLSADGVLVGEVLAYTACAILLLQSILHSYYSRKF